MTTSREEKPRIPESNYNLPFKDGTLANRDHGQGDCILFLYAGITHSRMRLPHSDALQGKSRMIMPELGGSGASLIPNSRFSHVEDLYSLCDELELGPLTLFGAFYGGRVAFEIARAHPDPVSGLLLDFLAAARTGHKQAALTPAGRVAYSNYPVHP